MNCYTMFYSHNHYILCHISCYSALRTTQSSTELLCVSVQIVRSCFRPSKTRHGEIPTLSRSLESSGYHWFFIGKSSGNHLEIIPFDKGKIQVSEIFEFTRMVRWFWFGESSPRRAQQISGSWKMTILSDEFREGPWMSIAMTIVIGIDIV